MSVAEAITQRRSIRAFTGKSIPDDLLHSLLEAARLAPSSLNSQPWRFKVLRNPAELSWLSGAPSMHQGFLAKAGVVFVCCVDTRAYLRDSETALAGYAAAGLDPQMLADISAHIQRQKEAAPQELFLHAALNAALAIENIMLHAAEVGLGSCWVGMFDEAAIKAHLNLGPNLGIVCLLPVGHPAQEAGPARRKTLDDIVLP